MAGATWTCPSPILRVRTLRVLALCLACALHVCYVAAIPIERQRPRRTAETETETPAAAAAPAPSPLLKMPDAEVTAMHAAESDMKHTMAVIAKEMFPAHSQAKGSVVEPAGTPGVPAPGPDGALDGRGQLAGAAAVGAEPALDTPAPLLRDGSPDAAPGPQLRLVADIGVVGVTDSPVASTDGAQTENVPAIDGTVRTTAGNGIASEQIDAADKLKTSSGEEESTAKTAINHDARQSQTAADDTSMADGNSPLVPSGITRSEEKLADSEKTTISNESLVSELPEKMETTTSSQVETTVSAASESGNVPEDDDDSKSRKKIMRKRVKVWPKKKPVFSDAYLPALIQIMSNVIQQVEEKEKKQSQQQEEQMAQAALATELLMGSGSKPEHEHKPHKPHKPSKPELPQEIVLEKPEEVQVVSLTEPDKEELELPGQAIIIIEFSKEDVAKNKTQSSKPEQSELVVDVMPLKSADPIEGKLRSDLQNTEYKVGEATLDTARHQVTAEYDEDMQEDMPIIQEDVPVINEETVPMMMMSSMLPSASPEMMVVEEEPEALFYKEDTDRFEDTDLDEKPLVDTLEITRIPPRTRREAPLPVPANNHKSMDRYVHYYPTLYFSDDWYKSPGEKGGYLGFREAPTDKDHVDLWEESKADVLRDDVPDEFDFESIKDDGFLVTHKAGNPFLEQLQPTPTAPPSKSLVLLVQLRFGISTDAKRQNFSKYQGFSDKVMADLAATSELPGGDQLGVVLAQVIQNQEIKSPKVTRLAMEVLKQLEMEDSELSKVLIGIKSLNYAP